MYNTFIFRENSRRGLRIDRMELTRTIPLCMKLKHIILDPFIRTLTMCCALWTLNSDLNVHRFTGCALQKSPPSGVCHCNTKITGGKDLAAGACATGDVHGCLEALRWISWARLED